MRKFGAWLSLVERLVRDQEVRSSNLRAPTNSFESLSGIAVTRFFTPVDLVSLVGQLSSLKSLHCMLEPLIVPLARKASCAHSTCHLLLC